MDKFNSDEYALARIQNLYYPFDSKDEWELASFLLLSNLSQSSINKLLSLALVSFKPTRCQSLFDQFTDKKAWLIIY